MNLAEIEFNIVMQGRAEEMIAKLSAPLKIEDVNLWLLNNSMTLSVWFWHTKMPGLICVDLMKLSVKATGSGSINA